MEFMEDKGKNTLRIRFLGAVGTVTGSCTLLEYTCYEDNKKQYFLIDAGSFQNEGNEEQNNEREKIIKYISKDIKIIFITHAHLDHIGFLPDIIKYGFKGKIYCTKATRELIVAMLTYGEGNENNFNLFKKISFNDIDGRHGEKPDLGFGKTLIPIARDFFFGYLRSSHILGSCSFYIEWTENIYGPEVPLEEKKMRRIHFSGDIGPASDLVEPNILFKGHQTPYWDKYDKCIVMESTYGEKVREKDNLVQRKIDKLSGIINKVIAKNGIIIIPAFALDRAQQILLDLFYIVKNRKKEPSTSTMENNSWGSVIKYFRGEAMCKNIASGIKTLQGKEKKSLRRNIQTEIEQICRNKKYSPECRFSEINTECQNMIANVFEKYNVDKPSMDEIQNTQNNIKFSFDSPLIEKINEVYVKHLTDEFYSYKDDKRKLKYISDKFMKYFDINNSDFSELKSEIRKFIYRSLCDCKDVKNPNIIVAASGMCDEGRMLNLLEKYFTNENATIILTGFQASGTNGFLLKNLLDEKYDENEKKTIPLKLNNYDFRLADRKCSIEDMSEFYSGHADQEQLLDYVTPDQRNSGKINILLNHGTNSAREVLKLKLEERNPKVKVMLPEYNKWLNILTFEYEPEDIEFNDEMNEFGFANVGDIHIYYPIKYEKEKIQAIINYIKEL